MKCSRLLSLFVAALLLASLFGPSENPVQAAPITLDGPTYTVNWPENGGDVAPGDHECADLGGHCTLRAAIDESNTYYDTNRIYFNLPGTLPIRTIPVYSELPAITNPVIINANTQPGCSTTPCVKLDGSYLDGMSTGLYLHSNGSTVKGLILVSFYQALRINGNANIIRGNYFGILPGDPVSYSNGYAIRLAGSNNLIGGTSAASRNIISASNGTGIVIGDSSAVTTTGNQVRANFIGTDETGTQARGNTIGISISSYATDTLIGGNIAGTRNVISGNYGDGIEAGGDRVTISGNYIGTGATGSGDLGNGFCGIYVFDATTRLLIGGRAAAERNRIMFNERSGICVTGMSDSRVTIKRNMIYANDDLGIDLGFDGVTANDSLDADSGPNALQNYPNVRSADAATDQIVVRLDSRPNRTYVIEFFSSPANRCDGSNHGEGRTYLGSRSVTTNATGYVRVTFTSPRNFTAGQEITATATDPAGRTSEFSVCRQAE